MCMHICWMVSAVFGKLELTVLKFDSYCLKIEMTSQSMDLLVYQKNKRNGWGACKIICLYGLYLSWNMIYWFLIVQSDFVYCLDLQSNFVSSLLFPYFLLTYCLLLLSYSLQGPWIFIFGFSFMILPLGAALFGFLWR